MVTKVTTQYEDYLKSLEEKEWSMSRDLPAYVQGDDEAETVRQWHSVNYLDYCDQVMGRPYGANGIGKLREVALIWPSEHENHPYWEQDPEWFRVRLARAHLKGKPDIDLMIRQHEEYAKLLEQNGVQVHWVELPSTVGPLGPFHRPSGAIGDLFVVRGGVIVGKYGTNPMNNGRASIFARWAANELGIPTLLTIYGTGVAEVAASIWLAEDVMVTALSASFNQEGLDQFIPVVKASSKDDIHVHVMRLANKVFWDQDSGACAHPNVMIGALDLGKVILYPPAVDYGTYHWLRENKFEIIEADHDEHVNQYACNIITLEPGKVMMHAGAKRSIAKVREAGVEVVELEFAAGLSKLDCATSKLRRDPGPAFFRS